MKLDDVLVIGISQSGESRDVLETVRRSKELGAPTLSVTNDEGSSMAGAADHRRPLRAGAEKCVAATKTSSAELLLLYLLVEALKGAETPGAEARALPGKTRTLPGSAWDGTARYRYAGQMVVTSWGYNLSTAQKAALKLMETSYVVAQPFSEADLKHGPIAMVTRDSQVLAIVPPGKVRSTMTGLVETLGERGAELVIVTDDEKTLGRSAAGFHMPVSCAEEASPVLYAVPPQLLAHDLSLLKGLDPDSPRGLNKVTESW